MNFLNNLFFQKYKEKSALLSFTCVLQELVSSGIPIEKALKSLSKMNGAGEKVRLAAEEISQNLDFGSGFYVSFKNASSLHFPSWYLSFVGCAEKSGNLPLLFNHLKSVLQSQSENRERFFSSLLYPIFIAIAALGFGIFASYFSSEFQLGLSQDKTALLFEKNQILRSFLPAGIFLLSSYAVIFVLMRRIFSGKKFSVILVFKSLSFLIENSIPIFEALSNCFSFVEKNKNLESALLLSIERIECGEEIAFSFSESFSEFGFKNEAEILNLNLSVCELNGKNDGFSKTADFFEKKQKKKIEFFLSLLQPVLMFVTAVYLWLILKESFLPFISSFGGEI